MTWRSRRPWALASVGAGTMCFMNKATSYLLIVLVTLGTARGLHAQPPPGPSGPPAVFANDPTPPPDPEFCPPNKPIERSSTVPFDNLCPVRNALPAPVGPDVQ